MTTFVGDWFNFKRAQNRNLIDCCRNQLEPDIGQLPRHSCCFAGLVQRFSYHCCWNSILLFQPHLICFLYIDKGFRHNLRVIIRFTTNHHRFTTICYWSMSPSAFFEIPIKWPVIIFIFSNDGHWWIWGSIVTSNEKGCLFGRCNRVSNITP